MKEKCHIAADECIPRGVDGTAARRKKSQTVIKTNSKNVLNNAASSTLLPHVRSISL